MGIRSWFKSAISGLFVSKREAETSPATTIMQHAETLPCAAEACTDVAPKRTAAQRATKRKPRK